jgi:hypothetical protein
MQVSAAVVRERSGPFVIDTLEPPIRDPTRSQRPRNPGILPAFAMTSL